MIPSNDAKEIQAAVQAPEYALDAAIKALVACRRILAAEAALYGVAKELEPVIGLHSSAYASMKKARLELNEAHNLIAELGEKVSVEGGAQTLSGGGNKTPPPPGGG